MPPQVCFYVLVSLLCSAIACRSLCAQAPNPARLASESAASPTTLVSSTPGLKRTSPLAKARELYRTGKLEAAEEGYKAILRDDPRSAPTCAGLARLYLKQKRVPDASAAAAKAFELARQMSAGHAAMGKVYIRQTQIAEAEKEFPSEVRRGTSSARAYFGLAGFYSTILLFDVR